MIFNSPVFESKAAESIDISNALVTYFPLVANNTDLADDSKSIAGNATSYSGSYAEFDGINDVITETPRANITSNNFSISIWVNPANVTQDAWIFNSRSSTGPEASDWQILYYQGKFSMAIYEANTINIVAAYNEYDIDSHIGVFNLWTVSCDGTTATFYKNDIVVSTSALTGEVGKGSNTTSIGKCGWSGNFYFKGNLAHARVWDRGINSAEVSAIFNEHKNSLGV